MIVTQRKLLFFLLGGVGLLLCGRLLYAGLPLAQGSNDGDACIRCHVSEYNQGMNRAVQHLPFWERKCETCHLQEGANWSATSAATSSQTTGTLTSQETLWRKSMIFGGEIQSLDHLATLTGLKPETTYRFRVLIAEELSQPLASSLWLGLSTRKIASENIIVTQGLDGETRTEINSLTINIVSSATATLRWKTDRPLYSWIELQDLDGLELAPTAIAAAKSAPSGAHPPLRDPEELAINACYQCHPESSLGTSHPVRLYGGRDVRIPDDLPTVDGMLTCVTCHDPHGSDGKMLVREVIKTKLCVTCHYKYKNSSPSTMFQ